jgi:multidrug resistance efflux pump|eukprot:COSAG01_NODE_8770_length_2665_cov_1.356586_2_plen_171_part_00
MAQAVEACSAKVAQLQAQAQQMAQHGEYAEAAVTCRIAQDLGPPGGGSQADKLAQLQMVAEAKQAARELKARGDCSAEHSDCFDAALQAYDAALEADAEDSAGASGARTALLTRMKEQAQTQKVRLRSAPRTRGADANVCWSHPGARVPGAAGGTASAGTRSCSRAPTTI